MKRLTREQMKKVTGGDDFGTCSASCPPGQAAAASGCVVCTFTAGEGGYDSGLLCDGHPVACKATEPIGTLG
jgi:hypothetical protein